MALRQIIIGDKITKAKTRKAEIEARKADAAKTRAALDEEEKQLEAAHEEVDENTPAEDVKVIEEKIAAWEEQEETLQELEAQIDEELEQVEQEITDLEAQLDEINERANTRKKTPECKTPETRKETNDMIITRKDWHGMDYQQRDAFVAREDVKGFAQGIRDMIGGNRRDIKGKELTIPDVMLPVIRTVAEENSKLLKHVNVQRVPGTSRINVMGVIPEAVWEGMCDKISELDWSVGQVEMDGYKVQGGLYLCNAIIEDSDLNLIDEVINMLGKAMGLAIDKAILYGNGTKMPKGIVARLAEESKPAGYSNNAPAWVDLHESHLIAVTGKTDAALFKTIVEATGMIDSDYARGTTFWAMNHKTRTKLIAAALSINAAGAIVSGIENAMPVVGGAIEELNFIPDDVIIGGYGDMYVVAERAGMQMAYSTEVKFMDDQTAFKGTARMDGMPVVPSAFVAIGINGAAPTAAMTFASAT